jgi:hypothetical protein
LAIGGANTSKVLTDLSAEGHAEKIVIILEPADCPGLLSMAQPSCFLDPSPKKHWALSQKQASGIFVRHHDWRDRSLCVECANASAAKEFERKNRSFDD